MSSETQAAPAHAAAHADTDHAILKSFGVAAAVLVAVVIWLAPTPEGLSLVGRILEERTKPEARIMAEGQHPEQSIETIAQWLLEGEHIVAFTGAGISTGSGIPDFRGPDGVWTRRDAGLPAPQWRVRPDQVKPNPSHLALVDLQRMGKLQFVITQNTDNLHRESGLRPELLAELHGNGKLMRCLRCDRGYSRQEVGWDTRRWGPGYRTQKPIAGQPTCPACKGRLISAVVNFGDPLPEKELTLADRHARQCDLMLVLGSSLVVNPAASLVGLALRCGARVVLVNQGETPYDEVVTLRVWTGIGDVIPPTVERLKRVLKE